jgi:hypothetical protein
MTGWELIAMACSKCPVLGEDAHERKIPAGTGGDVGFRTSFVRQNMVPIGTTARKRLWKATPRQEQPEPTPSPDWEAILRATTQAGKEGSL